MYMRSNATEIESFDGKGDVSHDGLSSDCWIEYNDSDWSLRITAMVHSRP